MFLVILVVALVAALLAIAYLLADRARHPFSQRDVQLARGESVAHSHAAVSGKVQEQLTSLFPGFRFNPRDARFLGSPIDFVVFDGLDEGEIREVVFLEVKTNRSALTHRERLVRDAILAKRVSWGLLRLSSQGAVPAGEVAGAEAAEELASEGAGI